jgi:hypothetical protein
MGGSTYSSTDRSTRAATLAYHSAPVNEIFKQNKERKCHAEMDPKNVTFREARDSTVHPYTVPIQLYLDVTGSMGQIPHDFIKDGLPTLIGRLIQNGVPDVALMFGAIGDHECDRVPLQVGQFESGDAELDMWLTRTYLEGNGGGNRGESYLLAWYFASHYVRTDAFDKRKKKGFIFTIGDEPCLRTLPTSAVLQIFGTKQQHPNDCSATDLLETAKIENHVYHICTHNYRPDDWWKESFGDHLLIVNDFRKIPEAISEVVLNTLKWEQDEWLKASSQNSNPILVDKSHTIIPPTFL